MIQVILMLVGFIYVMRIPRLRAMKASEHAPTKEGWFEEWKCLELSYILYVLAAGWGVFIISYLLANSRVVSPGHSLGDSLIGFQLIPAVVSLVLIVIAAIARGKATVIKRDLGIKWPK
jgi:hypothetical protein